MAKEKRLPIKAKVFDVNNQLPFSRCYFDAIYSHMLLNTRFSLHELHSIFSEIRRLLKSLSDIITTNPIEKVPK